MTSASYGSNMDKYQFNKDSLQYQEFLFYLQLRKYLF